ncbi:MAG: hybrid sensor histidine kinase/response regulator [Arenimonas sp.]|nr:hybrid sensor histidine kinase/response regulator [Arenimonas sp.]
MNQVGGNSTSLSFATAEGEHTPGKSQPTVLVVDDQQANVRMVSALLSHSGYRVLSALSGNDGLELARSGNPDLVLLDMKMPGMDGFEVLRQLREDAASKDLPVIFLTADNERENLVRAFAAGASDYIAKPFVGKELLARVATHVELKRCSDALRNFAREKQEMAELVAHDLRNYFANIIFAAELMVTSDKAAADQRRLLESIRSSADSGMLFLQTFLEQQEDQAHGMMIEPLPVRQMLREVVDLLGRSASAKNIALDLFEHETVVVSGLRAGVSHVLQNLVSNAIKYSPRGSRIDITALAHGKSGRIMVMDRGPGISERDQEKLFQRFVRLSSEPTEGESATGLGLASAKQHARAMGGNLWYEQRDGGGSIFALELPLS